MSSIQDLFGGGGGHPSGMGPGGPPGASLDSGGGGGVPGQPDSQQAADALQAAIQAIHDFVGLEEDDQDKTVAMKAMTALQGILGAQQKQDEAAMGTTPAHKAVKRATKKAQAQHAGGAHGGGNPFGGGGY